MKKRVLICGATGFIGRALVKKALCEDWVFELGVQSEDKAKEIFNELPVQTNIRKMNIVDENSINLKGIDVIINMAAFIPKNITDVKEALLVNCLGTYNLLNACLREGIKKFVHSSSMAVYGNPDSIPVDENHPKNPQSHYGISKLTGEHYCRMETFKSIQRIILRYSTVYGPYMDTDKIPAVFMNKLLNNDPVDVCGENSGDFVFVEDAAMANILAVKKDFTEHFIDFNIGSDKETKINEVVEIIQKISKCIGKVKYLKDHRLRKFKFDISKAQSILDYYPLFNINAGIKKYYDFKLNEKAKLI